MASQANKDILTRLADRGEQVVGRITDLPGAKAIMDSTTSLGKRLDEVQKRLRSIDPLEKRVTAVEKRLDKLDGKGSTKRAPRRGDPPARRLPELKPTKARSRSRCARPARAELGHA